MMRVGFVLVAMVAAPALLHGQAPEAPAPQPPVFGVTVDIVALDASVVDADGRPVLGLGPEDFQVEVDGRPRRLVSVEYVGRDIEPPAPPAPHPAHFSSNEDTPRGRLILLVVDRGNIGRGRGRDVLKAADRFLDTLAPGDRVGLAFVPGPGAGIEFTADVTDIRRGLKGVVGTADRGGHQVPLSEAISYIKTANRMRWDQFVTLTCGGSLPEGVNVTQTTEEAVPFTLAQVARCQRDLETDARVVYDEYRQRSLATQAALRTVLQTLERIDGPKTVVLLSEGLGTEGVSEVRDLGEAASRSQVSLFVLLLDTSSVEAAFNYSAFATQEDREVESAGLYELAAQARGAVLRVVGNGDAAFQRIARELMGYYVLGFEPEEGDRDGRGHQVRVSVSRPKATVRARGLLSIPSAPPSPESLLAAALRSPLVDRGLPLQAAAFALPSGTPDRVRVLIAARVGRAARPLNVAFALSNAAGKVASSRAYQGIAGDEGEWVDFTAEAVVPPDTYALRVAVVDAAGRRGSVEHAVKAALLSAGGIEISDLVLAPASTGGVRPAVDLEVAGGGLSALVELAGREPSRLAAASVALELAETADGPALVRVPVELGPAGEDGTRPGKVVLASGLLPPGDYTARAEVAVDGKAVAAVTRPFRVSPAAAGAAAARSPLAALLVDPPPFDRKELLAPNVLSPLVDRALAVVPGPPPAGVAAAVEEGRQGRPEAMLDRLGDAREDARVAFLRGVSLYARDNLPAAVTQLQGALRRSSELFPAAVYLGACYAAGGKDLDAIGAWQTALVGEASSPALYGLLSDALLRVKEAEQAVEILSEGLAAFPGDPSLRQRLGLAYAMAGRRDEALPLLTTWVEANPGDTRALFATLALLFEGFTREAAGTMAAEERQQLARYGRAYVDGGGPNREVVERWLKYLRERSGG